MIDDATIPDATARAATVLRRADALAACTEEPGRLTRRFATPALRDAGDLVLGWMRDAGMTARRDAIGNVVGRWEPAAATAAPAETLLLGSHLDTVRDAGRYDGMLGVLVALAVVEAARDDLPFALEVLGFADEEGVRYGTACLGSTALAGAFDPAVLDRRDADGIAMRDAIAAGGGDPDAIAGLRRDTAGLLGYVEVHIEQGPVLEGEDLPVGVVTGITGSTRAEVVFTGVAGHAGTVPMAARRDALAGAAEWIAAVEGRARGVDGLVATVGEATVAPGASNVIPGRVGLSLDVRHLDDAARVAAVAALRERAARDRRRTRARGDVERRAGRRRRSPCSEPLTRALEAAVAAAGVRVLRLPSGAGHDAAVIARLCDVAMLFVRCEGGDQPQPRRGGDGRRRGGRDRRRPPPRRRSGHGPAMSDYALAIRGGTVVAPDGVVRADVGVADGRIVAVAEALDAAAREEVDATGLHVLPGAVDAHVHFNDPGRADTEGFASGHPRLRGGRDHDGRRHAAQRPCRRRSTPRAFDAKRRGRERDARTSTSRCGAASCPARVDRLDELAARGVVGFKAFMSRQRHRPEFARADDLTLYEGMRRAATLGLPVAVHAESEAITTALAARARARRAPAGVRDYLASRPAIAEVEAIGRALLLARGDGLRAARRARLDRPRGRARRRGPRPRRRRDAARPARTTSCFDEEDAERLGARREVRAAAAPAPPSATRCGPRSTTIACMVASDHSPSLARGSRRATTSSRSGAGSPAARRCSALLLDAGHHERGARARADRGARGRGAARRFRLPGKGRIEPGADADLALVDLAAARPRSAAETLLHRHRPQPVRRPHAARPRSRARSCAARRSSPTGASPARPAGRLVTPETTEES